MNFSLSTFVVEVNSKAEIAFQTKWHGDAEQIGRVIEKHVAGLLDGFVVAHVAVAALLPALEFMVA